MSSSNDYNGSLTGVEERDSLIIGSERSLLGTVMAHGETIDVAEYLEPHDFSFPSHQVLWTEILILHRVGQLSTRAVVEALRLKGLLNSLGTEFSEGMGEEYIEILLGYRAPQSTSTFTNAIWDASAKRAIRRHAAIMAMDAETSEPAEDIIGRAEQGILDIRRKGIVQGQSIGSVLDRWEDRLAAQEAGTFMPAYRFHLADIRHIVSFLDEQDYALICARPGDGKSSLLRFEAYEEAKLGRPTMIVNLENSEAEYANYLIAYETGIDGEDLRDIRLLSKEDRERVRQAAQTLKDLPLTIYTLGAPSVFEVISVMRQGVRQGVKSIFVDYVQLIRNGKKTENEDLTLTSTTLRGFALQNHVPVICAAQFNRNIEHRGENADPNLDDLRGSGSLEQDATVVIALRQAWTNPTAQELMQFAENIGGGGMPTETIRAVPLRGFVKKNRNGRTGATRPFKWDRATNRFQTLRTGQQR
jgi:replicative DNA helicase